MRALNIIDLIIIVILVLGMLGGYQRGILKSLAGLAGNLLGLFCAYHYYPQLALWLDNQFSLQEKINQFFQTHLMLPQSVSQFKLGPLPLTEAATFIESLELPGTIKPQLLTYLNNLEIGLTKYTLSSVGDLMNHFLAVVLVNGLAFLLIWFLVNKLVVLVASLCSRVMQKNLLGSLDRVGGLILGFFIATLTLTILLGVMSPLLNLAQVAEPSLFAAVIRTIGEARLVPHFLALYNFLSTKITGLMLVS